MADDAYARRLAREELDASRVLGVNRSRARQVAEDEAYARALAEEEDARERERAASERRDANETFTSAFGDFFADVFGDVTLAAMGRARAGNGVEEREGGSERASAGASASGARVEFTVGRNGETSAFDLGDVFAGLEAHVQGFLASRGHDGRGWSILEVLNAAMGASGSGSGGTTEEERARIPVRAYARKASESENANCAVCLSSFADGERVKTLPCEHAYHPECVDRWLERSTLCPVCKRDVTAHATASEGRC